MSLIFTYVNVLGMSTPLNTSSTGQNKTVYTVDNLSEELQKKYYDLEISIDNAELSKVKQILNSLKNTDAELLLHTMNKYGDLLLHRATRQNCIDIIQYLIEEKSVDANLENKYNSFNTFL